MTLEIAMGNGHNKDSLVKWAKEADAHSFGAHEVQDLLDEIRRQMPFHRVTVAGRGYHEERGREKSTCLITNNNLENLGEFTRKVSERVPGNLKLAPDRIMVGSFYAHPVAQKLGMEGIAHFALHPDAAPNALRGDDPKHPVVAEYTEALHSAGRWLRVAKRDGLIPILSGDLQLPPDVDRAWSPKRLLVDAMDMEYVNQHIDWILWDPMLEMVPGSKVVRELHDHKGIKVALRPAA
jgi:hypothetical protein